MTDTLDSGLAPEKIFFVRIFVSDGSYADARLIGTWEAFLHQLMTNGCVITSTVWINRQSVVKMVVMEALPEAPVGDNIIEFIKPQGSA
jgi:hypothetical protein